MKPTAEWKHRLGIVVAALAESYRQTITTATIKGYEMGLDDLPIESIERAARAAMRANKFMPTVAELRELAGELSPADRAVRAWEAVEKAFYTHGDGPSLDFDDPLTNATIHNLGGWEAFCDRWEEDGKKWLRKDFERVYTSLCRAGVRPEQCGRLVGFNERSNRFNGYTETPPGLALACGLEPVAVECGLPPVPLMLPGGGKRKLPELPGLGEIGKLPPR